MNYGATEGEWKISETLRINKIIKEVGLLLKQISKKVDF